MTPRGGRLLRVTRTRPIRGIAALTLLCAVASSGLVAVVTPPARAAAAAPALLSSPALSTDNDPTPRWSFGVAAVSYECSFTPAASVPSYAACTSPFTAPSLTADGSYRFAVRQATVTDDGAAATSDYVYDTTAQVTLGAPASPARGRAPQWAVAVEPGGSATCRFDGGADTDCTSGYTGTIPADGTDRDYVLAVRAVDALGNQAERTSTYTLDTTAPDVPVVTASRTGDGNIAGVQWTWPTGSGDTSSCALVGPVPAGPGPCTSPYVATLTTDGTYRLDVVVTDVAANGSLAGSSLDYRFDRTAPAAPTFTSSPAAAGTSPTPTWTFTTSGDPTSCQVTGTSNGPQPAFDCTTGATPALPGDDSWTLTVTSRDAAGNTSATTSGGYVLDRTGPAAPTVSAPASPDNDAAPHFTWVGELPSSAECRLLRTDTAGTTYGAWADCTARLFTPTLSGDADYRVQARLTDPLGNLGAIGTSSTYSYDGTAPAQPTVSGPAAVANDATPTFGFTPEPGSSAQCQVLRAGAVVASASCSGGSYTPTLTDDGSYVIEVVLTDAVGNASQPGTRAYQLDATGPTVAVLSAPPSPGRDDRPSWGISGDADSTLACTLLSGGSPVTPATTCTNGYLADLTVLGDGTYVLEVVGTDAVGNATTVTSSYVLDTVAPLAPPITAPASPGNAASPAWTFPVQAQTTARCRLVEGLSPGAYTDCSGGRFTVIDPADGTYTVDVLVTDLAGNEAPLASSTSYTSDRTAPAEAVVAGPSGLGNVTTPTWTWTGESGVRATCRLDRNGAVGPPVRCDSGTYSPALTGDATYVVTVRLTDQAGNRNAGAATAAYQLDSTAPARPVVTGPSGSSNDAAPRWSWSSEAGARSECRLDEGAVLGTWATCTSSLAVALSTDGVYVLNVRVVDPAGNASAVASSASYTYDGTAPAAPSVTAPPSPSNVLTPSFSFTGEGTASAQCRLLRAGALVRDWAACSSPATVDLTGLPDASYVLEARLTDLAGNTGPSGDALPYALDTTAPLAPVVTGPSGPSTLTSPTFTWTAAVPGTTSLCRLVRDGVGEPTTTACASPWSPVLVRDGQWSLQVRLEDVAGNRSAPGQSGAYVLDTTAPVAPVVTAPASPGRDTAPSWSAVVESGTSAECRLSTGAGTVISDWAACRLPLTTDLSTRTDGTYVLAVRATDLAGLVSAVGSGTYVLDTTAPVAPVFTSVPASPSKARSISFPFTSEPGVTTTCRLSRGSTVVTPDTVCSSPVPVSFAGLPDGSYTLAAHATDVAGNSGPAATTAHVLDTAAPPAPVLVSGPASISPDRTPIWVFTAESRASVVCRVTGAASGVAVPDAPCVSPFAPDLTSRPDDTYTLAARATDQAGNTGPPLSSGYLLDASAPLTAVVAPPPSPGRDLTPTWQVSTTEGSVQCKLVKGATLLRDWTACGPTFSSDLTGRGDGTFVLSARVVDPLGNLSAEVTSRYVLDTAAPGAATLTTPASPANDRAPTWSVASAEPGVTAQCQVLSPNGGVALAFAACAVSAAGSPYDLDLGSAVDGSWTLVVRLTDAVGNVGPDVSGSYLLDTGRPNAVLVATPKTPSPIDTPTWQLTGDSDAVLECRLSGGTFTGTAFSPCTTTAGVPGAGWFTANLTAQLDGSFTLAVRSRDAAGNLGPETTSTYEIDRQPPAPPTVPMTGDVPSQEPVVVWSFTVAPGATALCTLSRGATVLGQGEQPCTAPYTTDLDAYGDGDYTLSVRAADAAGNTSPSVPQRYVLDRLAPALPLYTASPAARSRDTTPQWSFAAGDPADRLECRLAGVALPTWAPCTSPATYDLGPDAVTGKVFQLEVRAIDLAGNVSLGQLSAPYELDLSAPLAPTVLAPAVVDSSDRTPQFTVELSPEDTETVSVFCAVTLPSGVVQDSYQCAVGPVAVDLSGVAETQGTVTLAVHGQDVAGNVSAPASANYFFDAEPPATPVVQAPDPAADLAATTTFTWEGPADAVGYTCEVHLAGSTGPWTEAPCASGDTVTMTAFGAWTVHVRALDKAGNRSAQAGTATYTYLPPVPRPAAPVGPRTGADSTPTWTFVMPPPGTTATCLVDLPGGGTLTETPCTSPFTLPADPERPSGTYALAVRYTDAYGNVGKISSKALYRYTLTLPVTGGGIVPVAPAPPAVPAPGRPADPVVPPVPPVPPAPVPAAGGRPPVLVVEPLPPRGVVPPVPSAAKPGTPSPRSSRPGRILQGDLEEAVRDTVLNTIKEPTVPLILLVVLGGFLLVQNRIDRRDPKLASAPVGAEPELDFGPVLGRGSFGTPLGGGAPA